MYIGRIMHTDLVTVSPETSLVEARAIQEKKEIDHLLVIDKKNNLVGLVSDRDLKQAWASPATSLSTHELNYILEKVEVETIMTKTVVTVPTSTTIERAAFVMQQHKISSLPVMEDGQLVGIITSTDVLDVLLNAIGISDDSVRLSVFVKESIGILAKVADAMKDADINILSLTCWPEKDYKEITQLVIRVGIADSEKAVKALGAEGLKVTSKYERDISPFLPE